MLQLSVQELWTKNKKIMFCSTSRSNKNTTVGAANLFLITIKNWKIYLNSFFHWMKPATGTCNNCLNWLHSLTDNIICDLVKWQWNKFGLRCSTYYILCSKAAVLNLGYAYPWGYAINSQGVCKQLAVTLKNTQYLVILVFNLIKIKIITIFGTIT